MRFVSFVFGCCLILSAKAASLNEYQVIGSHNSYKKPLPVSLLAFLNKRAPGMWTKLNYSHPSLTEQLDMGLRQLEIDVVNDPQGGQYHAPETELLLNDTWFNDQQREHLAQPGFKVMHIPHLDMQTHCVLFSTCLTRLVTWSNAHPNHFPITILVNAKETQPDFISRPSPAPFSAQAYKRLDDEIAQLLKHKLVTPDEIRGEFNSLKRAVLTQGWPQLDSLRGKFLFIFDASTHQRAQYVKHAPSLKGRSMFISVPEEWDEAAIFIRNNPRNQLDDIRALVAQGFLVRTRADANLSATTDDMALQKQAAFASGAQFISTDFYAGALLSRQRGHVVSFESPPFVRSHPFLNNNVN